MNPLNTVAFYTLGCKLNFSETSTIARNFVENNFKKVAFNEPADVYVINTCSVTENADNKFKSVVKRANKSNPNAFIIAIGCYAQLKPNDLANVLGVNLVLGANEKFNILHYLDKISH
jgi:threonylcarbamoyladenosine tRNA methylthiotransferase MtaB